MIKKVQQLAINLEDQILRTNTRLGNMIDWNDKYIILMKNQIVIMQALHHLLKDDIELEQMFEDLAEITENG